MLFVQISVMKSSSFWVQSCCFFFGGGANMGLFPHLSRVRILMLRVTMLTRMIY